MYGNKKKANQTVIFLFWFVTFVSLFRREKFQFSAWWTGYNCYAQIISAVVVAIFVAPCSWHDSINRHRYERESKAECAIISGNAEEWNIENQPGIMCVCVLSVCVIHQPKIKFVFIFLAQNSKSNTTRKRGPSHLHSFNENNRNVSFFYQIH